MNKRLVPFFLLSVMLYSCSTTQKVAETEPSKPPKPIDFSTLLEPPRNWHHLDEQESRFRGISSQLAYQTILKDKSPGKKVIVAVIDGGVDTDHEDLKEVIWVNEDEVPDNQKDDDKNGYVDDIHGWNFIGGPDGENINHDTFELTRIYRRLHRQFSNADTTQLTKKQMEKYMYYKEIRSGYKAEVEKLVTQYNNIQSLEQSMKQADQILDQHFGSETYAYAEVRNLQPQNRQQQFARSVMMYVMENGIDSTLIADQKEQIYEFAKYGYNPEFNPRHIVGDDYEDKTERYYGNNDVTGPDAGHGTHVAGIIAAIRNNEVGMNGVSTHTRIMAVRAVPNGDERDKDVANAIRYAVDNGASVINMSFGKGYSPYKEVVDQAVKYAEENGVLLVHGAGNDAEDTDVNTNYPTAVYGPGPDGGTTSSLWLSVGATSWKPNEEFIAGFSNYGDQTVDVFAPGVDIYSTMPDNVYERQDGTSMAAPVVSGIAALIMVYYPELTTQQIRDIILESAVKYPEQKVRISDGQNATGTLKPFSQLSASGGLVNVYEALQAAEELSSR